MARPNRMSAPASRRRWQPAIGAVALSVTLLASVYAVAQVPQAPKAALPDAKRAEPAPPPRSADGRSARLLTAFRRCRQQSLAFFQRQALRVFVLRDFSVACFVGDVGSVAPVQDLNGGIRKIQNQPVRIRKRLEHLFHIHRWPDPLCKQSTAFLREVPPSTMHSCRTFGHQLWIRLHPRKALIPFRASHTC